MKHTVGTVINRILISFLLVWITSCSGTKTSGDLSSQNKKAGDTPHFIFLNYSIKRDSIEGYKVELINKIVSDGKIKMNTGNHSPAKAGDLKCLALNEDKHPISNINIPDPLIKTVEYQNENGLLAKREVKLDSTVFSVRMQLDKHTKFIALERINPPNSSYLIITEIK